MLLSAEFSTEPIKTEIEKTLLSAEFSMEPVLMGLS